MAESTCKFYIILCTTCLPTLVKYISMLEGLNKIFIFLYYYLDFYSLVLRLFIDGSLNAVKLQIYGSSVIKTILREPWFPDRDHKRDLISVKGYISHYALNETLNETLFQ